LDEPLLAPLARRWDQRVPLSADEREALISLPATRKSCPKDAYIVREGETTSTCVLLLKGFAYRQKFVGEGARQIISLHIPGEFVDLQNCLLPVSDHNVQSLEQTELAFVSKTALLDLTVRYPSLAKAMWLDTLVDASIHREWVVNVGRRDAKTRLAHLLCELALRLEASGAVRDGIYQFPLTQEQLADATGLTAVHTNRTLQALRKDGLISLSHNALRIHDWKRLRDVGDFSERYLHYAV